MEAEVITKTEKIQIGQGTGATRNRYRARCGVRDVFWGNLLFSWGFVIMSGGVVGPIAPTFFTSFQETGASFDMVVGLQEGAEFLRYRGFNNSTCPTLSTEN